MAGTFAHITLVDSLSQNADALGSISALMVHPSFQRRAIENPLRSALGDKGQENGVTFVAAAVVMSSDE